jgi:casein kinase I homolog HRR25
MPLCLPCNTRRSVPLGTVYLGTHHIAGKPVAIKLEAASSPSFDSANNRPSAAMRKSKSNPNIRVDKAKAYPGASPLTLESQIYKRLCGAPGVPFLLHSGRAGPWNVLILDLLGSSLDELFKICNKSFSLKTICMLADQLLERIEFIHSRGLVHRDIKPANFVMGRSGGAEDADTPRSSTEEAIVNVIDFGLAKKYRDAKGAHIPYSQQDCHGVGTSLFAAINTHMGVGTLTLSGMHHIL